MSKTLFIIVIILAILLGVGGLGYYANRGQLHYYWYAHSQKHNPLFSQYKSVLHQSFIDLYADTSNIQGYMNLGTVEYELKDYKSAARSFLTAVTNNPHVANAYVNLIRAYEQDKQYKQAEDYAKQFVLNFPYDSASYSALAELYQFYITDQQPQLPHIYEQAYANTKDPQFLILEAQTAAAEKDYKKAAGYIQQWLDNITNTNGRQLIEHLLKEYQSKIH